MDDAELLRTERDLYTIYCKYTLRNGVTATTGTTSAVLTAGASMLITAPLLTSRAIYLRTISQELAACSKLVQQRGLTSLPTPYWQIATTGALTVALGAVSLVVQVPGIDGVVDWLLPDAIEHALEHAIEDVADAVAEEVVENVVETATGRAVVRGVEMVATETITWLQHSALAEALHAAFHVDVVAVLEPKLELWTTLLHDNAALQAKLAEHIVKQIHVRVEAGLLAILSLGLAYVARRDLDTFLATRRSITDPAEARRHTREFVFAPPSKLQESRGFFSWIAGRRVVVQADVAHDFGKMTDAALLQAQHDLIEQAVHTLRGVFDATSMATDPRVLHSDGDGDGHDKDAAEYTLQVEALALARALVLLQFELAACLDEMRRRTTLRCRLKSMIDIKCASASLLQTASGITQLVPAQDSKLRALVLPSPELGALQATWVGIHLRQQIQRLQHTTSSSLGRLLPVLALVIVLLARLFWWANLTFS
ncbi:hypothetical protein PINS_up019201 [Pythium insidiosum]|nr:hypothetical protein PINS_up019201 [Pythium insidiosum]